MYMYRYRYRYRYRYMYMYMYMYGCAPAAPPLPAYPPNGIPSFGHPPFPLWNSFTDL